MIFKEDEIFIRNGEKQDLPGFDSKYHNIVDYILKITDEIWEQRAIWVIYDTYEKDILIHVGAQQIHGVESVVAGTIKTLASFPDRKMGGEAVIWSKDDNGDFFSSHRIGSTATNLGETEYGPATHKKVFFRTIADCAVRENKIFEEWLVRDNLHLIEQLDFDPVEMAKRDPRYKDGSLTKKKIKESFAENGKNGKLHSFDLTIPEQLVQSLFEDVWNKQNFDQIENYYFVLGKVHSICEKHLIGPRQVQAYLEDLFLSFPNAKIEVQRITCNQFKDETEVAVRWELTGTHSGDGFFGPASQKEISLPGICHYVIKEGKIHEEWMLFDGYDVLCQIHAEGNINTLPNQNAKVDHVSKNKKNTLALIQDMNKGSQDKKEIEQILQKYFSKDIELKVTKPFKETKGLVAYVDDFWSPILASFSGLENQPYILVGGEYEGREYVSFTGNFIGNWEKDWLGIPATKQPTWLRYSTTLLFEKGKIVKAWYFFDILDVMRQAGFNFFPNKGIDQVPPGPLTGDGIIDDLREKNEGQKTLMLTNAMLDALGEYDGRSLESMGQERFWDVNNMMWYGPSGIGTTRGLKGFQENHQVPFLTGFPDRGITPKKGKDYFAQIGEGNYSCDFGFPAMYGTHNGDGWLGLKATGINVTLRVVDYWRRDGAKLVENWVFIDMIDVLDQLGVDVFKLLAQEIENKNI